MYLDLFTLKSEVYIDLVNRPSPHQEWTYWTRTKPFCCRWKLSSVTSDLSVTPPCLVTGDSAVTYEPSTLNGTRPKFLHCVLRIVLRHPRICLPFTGGSGFIILFSLSPWHYTILSLFLSPSVSYHSGFSLWTRTSQFPLCVASPTPKSVISD